MQLLSTLGWITSVKTKESEWVVPMRLAVGVLLLFPADGSIQQLFSIYPPVAGSCIRAAEMLAGICFLAGCGIRLAVFPTVIIFAIRALANGANSFTWLRDVLDGMIAPRGDWTIGATYFGVAMLLNECLVVGSGRWSVDLWLSKRIEAVEQSSHPAVDGKCSKGKEKP
jgi:putative oxidoreductase